MKKNRRVKKRMSVNTRLTTYGGVCLLSLFIMVILNFLASSGAQRTTNAIGAKEKQLKRLQQEVERQEEHWQSMKTPAGMTEALRKHGLAMKPPRPDQIIHLNADGVPYGGQLAILNAKRQNAGRTASLYRGR